MNGSPVQYLCIVVKSSNGPVCLVRSGDGLRLPQVTLPADAWLPDESAEVNAQLMERHGLSCTLLRWLGEREGVEVVVMEWHPGSPIPERGIEWIDPANPGLAISSAGRSAIDSWRASAADRTVPWEQAGWMQRVVNRLVGLFDGVRLPRLTNLAQIKAGWGMSTVLLIETTDGNYYFKAGARQGIDEGELVSLLHQRYPQRVPRPVLIDADRGWMITREIIHEPFAPGDVDGLAAAFRAYAEIQLGCGDLFESGRAPGIRLRDAFWLRVHLDAFYSGQRCPPEFAGIKSELDPGRLEVLRDAWLRRIEALEASELPLALNQEDLHFDNILNTRSGPVFIDWADCAIAHPLFGFQRILALWGQQPSDQERREREQVRSAYLGAFGHLLDPDALERELDTVKGLRMFYLACHWQEIARQHRSGSQWSRRCRENSERFLRRAIDQETGTP